MNLSNHVNVRYCSDKNLSKNIHSNLYVRHEPIIAEDHVNIFEVVKRKKVIEDRIHVAAAFFILSHAKLHVLKVCHIKSNPNQTLIGGNFKHFDFPIT